MRFVSFWCGSLFSVFLVAWLLMASSLVPISSLAEAFHQVLTEPLVALSSKIGLLAMVSSLGGSSKLANGLILMLQQPMALKSTNVNNFPLQSLLRGLSRKVWWDY